MLSFTTKLKQIDIENLFTFNKDSCVFASNEDATYGVEESYLFSDNSTEYFETRINRINDTNRGVIDKKVLNNQLLKNEIYSENDSSISIGNNDVHINGPLYYYTRSGAEYDDSLITSANSIQYLWQMQLGDNLQVFPKKFFDFDNQEDYAVMMIDTNFPDKSKIINTTFKTDNWKTERWTGNIAPDNITDPPNSDTRPIKIVLLNPKTGEIYDSKQYDFYRHGSLIEHSNIAKFVEDYDVFDSCPVISPFEMSPNPNNKPAIKNIFTTKNDVKYILIEGEEIPVVNNIEVVVEYARLPNRKYEVVDTESYTDPMAIMKFMHVNIQIVNSNSLSFSIDNPLSANSSSFTVTPTTNGNILVCCKCDYQLLDAHDPQNNYYDYVMSYTFKINNEEYAPLETRFQGSKKQILDRGIGESIDATPTFENMPICFGYMPYSTLDRRSMMPVKIQGRYYDYNVVDKIKHIIPLKKAFIDNFCSSKTKDLFAEYYYDLYWRTFEQFGDLSSSLINYWACDSITTAMNEVPNKFSYSSIWYDVYSNMRVRGEGWFTHKKEKYHNVVDNYIEFNNITGNANLLNTWDRNRKYGVNLWFKSSQKTKGVILTDMEHQTASVKGLYIGVSPTGNLEVSVNSQYSRIYNNVVLTDDNWHMITVSVSGTTTTIYFDAENIDSWVTNRADNNKEYTTNLQVYFMGHPLSRTTNGCLSRISFFNKELDQIAVASLYYGDVLHTITGRIFLQNMPFDTEVRIYNNRTGELMDIVMSDKDTGEFIYQNYTNPDVYVITANRLQKYGTMQVVGPVEPKMGI